MTSNPINKNLRRFIILHINLEHKDSNAYKVFVYDLIEFFCDIYAEQAAQKQEQYLSSHSN